MPFTLSLRESMIPLTDRAGSGIVSGSREDDAMTAPTRTGFCRDCLADAHADQRRCHACGSPRLLRHPEIETLTIAHIDCDAFYATVEKRDDPSLNDRPVIIGGGKRGVVSTCCYIARISGVRSAMPMFKALQLCPEAVVIKPDMEKYSRVGRQVREKMLQLTPLVEPLSIDEAFLDLSGTQKLHHAPPAWVLAQFAREVQRDIGITVSVGLSYNKFLAKIASDLDKPRGFAVVGRTEALDFLSPKSVGIIWGVGKASQERLLNDGFRTIADLRRADPTDLIRRYGTLGQRLWRLSRGEDDRRVEPSGEAKSISVETTLEDDLRDGRQLEKILFRLSEKLAFRLKNKDLSGRTLTMKLKTSDFRLRSRSRSLPFPTALASRIFEHGRDLLDKEVDGTAFRLVGIGMTDFSPLAHADPPDLAEPDLPRRKQVEQAVDALRAKFGAGSIVKGIVLDD